MAQEPIDNPIDPTADPKEVCEIVVEGSRFSDWESVWVQHRWGDAWPIFRFVAAERPDPPQMWTLSQIVPGDDCQIYMGEELAVTGMVTVRQTAYDANSHSVSIQGVGTQWLVWRGAILNESQNHPGNFLAAMTSAMSLFGVAPVPIGALDPTPYKPPAHNEVGESVFQFGNRIGASRKAVLGANHRGDLLLIGEWTAPVIETLKEGVNIKACQCVIAYKDIYNPVQAQGQTMRSDGGSPGDAAQQRSQKYPSRFLKRYSPVLVPLEHPVWTKAEVEKRAVAEREWGDGTIIEATVVVYGWFTTAGVLWAQLAGYKVILDSPMTTLVNRVMKIRTVTLTQDGSSGTQTILDLVAPWLLNDTSERDLPRDDPLPDIPPDP